MEISYTNKLRITWVLLSMTALLAIIALHVSVNNNQVKIPHHNFNEDVPKKTGKEINFTSLYHDVQDIKSHNISKIEPELLIIRKRIDKLESNMEYFKKRNITDAQHDIMVSNKVTEIQNNITYLKEGFVLVILYW